MTGRRYLRVFFLISITGLAISTSSCTVVSVVDAAASTAVDVAVGAVKTTGKVIGGAVDAVTPDSD